MSKKLKQNINNKKNKVMKAIKTCSTTSNILSNFIFETTVISPIQDIVNKLKNDEFRDCDVAWLNDRLNKYSSFALKTLNMNFSLGEIGSDILNDFVKNQFSEHFNTLLKYFKSFD